MQKLPTNLNISHQYVIPLALIVIIVLLSIAGDNASQWLQFERSAIADGEIWRMLTANLVHLGWSHSLLNLAGLVLIWMLFGNNYSWRQWLIIIISSFLATTLGLLLFNNDIKWYVGLSGSLHGLFIAGALAEARIKSPMATVLLVVVAMKLLWEQFQGPLPGTSDVAGGTVIVDAHLYGALSGIGAIRFKLHQFNQQDSNKPQ